MGRVADGTRGAPRADALAAARAAASASLAVAAFAGLFDVLGAAGALSRRESVQAVGLWMLLSLPAAAAASVAAAIAERLRPARTRGAWPALAVGVLSQTSIVALVSLRELSAGSALALSAALVAGCAALSLSSGWVARSARWAALVAAACLAAAFARGAIRPAPARAPSPAATGAAPASAPAPRATPAPDARALPTVVLIVLDTQRADYLGVYGSARGLTPALDAFARECTVFDSAFAPAPWTVPSHASLFTGLYPMCHGASFVHHRWLDDRFVTIAEALRARGYETAAFSANDYIHLSNLDQGFDGYDPIGERFAGLVLRRPLELLGAPAKWIDHGAADGAGRLESFLAAHSARRRPLFVFVNLLEPHWRHLPHLPDRLATLPPGVDVVTATLVSAEYYGPLVMAGKAVRGPLREAVPALYAGAVRYQDRQLGRILSALRERLDLDSTLVIVTSDHGENLGDGGRWDHVFAVNDALVRVPLLVRYPRRFPPGLRVGGLCELIDVPATIADVVGGVALDSSSAGRSLAPDGFVPRSHVFVEGDPYLGHLGAMSGLSRFDHDVGRFAALLRAVRDRRHKLVWSSSGTVALYDVAADPDETRNVIVERPEVAASLRAALDAWLATHPHYRAAAGHERDADPAEPEEIEALRSLGYVD
jgi:arylsulfatase A-like enzyme